MRTSVVIAALLALASVAPVTAAPVAPGDRAAIRTFLGKLYLTYRGDPSRNWGRAIGERNVYTPATFALLAENRRLLKGELGDVETDVFCACQDYDASLKLVSVGFRPLPKHLVSAAVTLNNHGRTALNVQFEKTARGWRVYDVELPKQGMLRHVLATENASLKHKAG